MDKQFWMPKANGQVNNIDPIFDNPSRMEPKRPRGWFLDDTAPELFPSKKQALETSINKPESVLNMSNPLNWESSSRFQSVPNQFMDRLFGSETNLDGSNNVNDSSVGLSMSYGVEDPETGVNYGGIRKVKVNQVKDSENGLHMEHSLGISMDRAYNRISDNNFFEKGIDENISMSHSYSKVDSNTISFGGYHGESVLEDLARPVSSYNLIYEQPSVQASETPGKKEVDLSNGNTAVVPSPASKPRPDPALKHKSVTKPVKKEAPNSFPSNVRSLLATGMLDGVPVRYVSVSREELRGIIKGSGYLCGCQTCNYSKALNAFEFERHAGCKTKHPNNHIYFENGKTIYQIVQELRNTSEGFLFDAVQTVTGSPINQKAFRIWKESFQAAMRELQRIYGKQELKA